MTRSARLTPLVVAALVLVARPAAADPWYEHYARAEKALEDQNWTLAVEEINAALERKGDSGARVRTYGMKVTPYFPYLKLGVAYYHLGQLDAARQAFETEERLGAVTESAAGSAELERFKSLVEDAQRLAAAEAQRRVRQIVEQSLREALELEARGLLDEATAAVDQALAVAPDDVEARAAINRLRQGLAERERARERDQRIATLVEDGRGLLGQGRFGEASSLFRQALSLQPSAEVQELLTDAQRRLLAELEASRGFEGRHAAIAGGLDAVRDLESAGRLAAALDRLQSVLALEPSNRQAVAIQDRLLEAQRRAEAESSQQASIGALLAEAESWLQTGSAEESLAAANRVLALDPGNPAAVQVVARAYGVISQRLLGTGARGNLPPAVRFVDLRLEGADGALVETVRHPDFYLRGVVIDDSTVDVAFYDSESRRLEAGATVNSQPLGEFYITEFNLGARLAPGLSTFRLQATDAEGLSSGSAYAVFYRPPVLRSPWLYGLLFGISLVLSSAFMWRRSRQRERLRRRRFNPYVAGAPVLDEGMFFGRRELVDRILQTIHNNSLLLYGERRIGKTSIQHQLKKRLEELDDPNFEFHPVYIDLQGTAEARFFATMAEDVFQELGPVLDGLAPAADISGEYTYRDFVRDVHAVLKVLKKRSSKRVKLVLLIDEVDVLNDYDPRINQKLRSLFMKSFAGDLVAVVSGVKIKKHWSREGSPWYNFFEEIEVRPLGQRDARELVERPIRGIFKLDDGVAERVVALTDGKPYLIQKLCISLVTRLHEERRRRITVEDVDAFGRPEEA